MSRFADFFFKAKSSRALSHYQAEVRAINALEPKVQAMADEAIVARMTALRADIEEQGIIPHRREVFALVREMSKRTLGMRHHDVQLIGGLALTDGRLAEMKTGEGKTLVVTLAASLMALANKGVHVVTVNAYLASRDAAEMRPLYESLGLSVGVTLAGMSPMEKQAAYANDITYGVNHEFGFDYLRDNMVHDVAMRTQRQRAFAIIDEVDSILIDEARTPLIISDLAKESNTFYLDVDAAVRQLTPDVDYLIDEKEHRATLTDSGFDKVEDFMVQRGLLSHHKALYSPENLGLLKHISASVLAHSLYSKDRTYVVRDNEVVIVDEATGRLMPGRRWPEGLHEAVEAKEGVPVQPETRTQATITYQNYFTGYGVLSGLTGTAATEAEEFAEIYGLQTVVIPTHRPVVRKDYTDLMFRTKAAKYAALVKDVKERQSKGQPVLVGTGSVEESERLSVLFDREGVRHQVLNAKQNAQEAAVVAQAGLPGAVTIATNMAGRGTDILLGGNWKFGLAPEATEAEIADARAEWEKRNARVKEAGGLHVLGTERHESRRVDNQLRGRAGRQGDAGSSQFYLSLEDKLLRLFATNRLDAAMGYFDNPNEAVAHPWLAKLVQQAQKKLEGRGFDARRELLKYDNVFSEQRNVVYRLRNEILEEVHLDELVHSRLHQALESVLLDCAPAELPPEMWDVKAVRSALKAQFGIDFPVVRWVVTDELDGEEIHAKARDFLDAQLAERQAAYADIWVPHVKKALLLSIDELWISHLTEMEELRLGMGLRSMAQQNPSFLFAQEGFELFKHFLKGWSLEASRLILEVSQDDLAQPAATLQAGPQKSPTAQVKEAFEQHWIRRNDPCPCNSGKKFKECHGKLN